MERDSIVFYRSFYEAIRLQPKKLQADIYNAVFDYALNGIMPDTNNGALSIFLLIKPQIDANNERYESGKKGGRPKKIKTNGFENAPQSRGFEKPNVNENVNENVNVNDNENVNVNDNVNENEKNNYQLIADMYNATCVSFPRCTTLSDSRKKALRARLNKYDYEDFGRLFQMAEDSDFLKGANKKNWSASFDWLIKDENMAKVLDGNYVNRAAPPTGGGNPFMELYNEMEG